MDAHEYRTVAALERIADALEALAESLSTPDEDTAYIEYCAMERNRS